MKLSMALFISVLLYSCKKIADNSPVKLLRTEATDNSGNVWHTGYNYDNSNRIIAIQTFENNDTPVIAVSISYHGNEVVLLSDPGTEPVYDQTMEVHLSLDENGKLLKRIEYIYGIEKNATVQPSVMVRYDTLTYAYDAAGLLQTTTGSRYDSNYVDTTLYRVSRYTSTASYTNDGNNLTSTDEHVSYPIITKTFGVITNSGGSSEYRNIYNYPKLFPNHKDFKNEAVLNEYNLYYEPPLNSNYKNIPDQVIRSSIDKDLNGTIIFTGSSTINIQRTYNDEELLSEVNILSLNTPYKVIRYFYGK